MGISPLLVKRTKFLYGALALLMFGALGTVVQLSESTAATGAAIENSATLAPALSEACEDTGFYVRHVEPCAAAIKIAADPTKVATPSSLTVSAEVTNLSTNPVNR